MLVPISCSLIILLDRTNNPFAPSTSPSISPSNQTQQRRPSPSFNLPSTYEIHSPSHLSSLSSSPAPSSSQTPSNQQGNQGQKPFAVKKKDDENESLAALFADREGGQDTFGNVGALRFVILYFSNILFKISYFLFCLVDTDIRMLVDPFWQTKQVQATIPSPSSSSSSNSKITRDLSLISKTTFDMSDIPTDLNLCSLFFYTSVVWFFLLARVFLFVCYHHSFFLFFSSVFLSMTY